MARTDAAILAAGGILWRPGLDGDGLDVLLVHRPRYRDWTFPKGKVHKGESLLESAIREVGEETGLSVVVGHRIPTVGYRTIEGPKEVTYWTMQPGAGDFTPNSEVDKVRWVPMARASRKLTYSHDRRLADALVDQPPSVVRVLLVRHAAAGNRGEFDGDDLLRPLSDRGLRQSEHMVALLQGFAPTRLMTAPALRCIQTVEPVAKETGLAIEQAPMFGESEFSARPEDAAERLRAVLDSVDDVTVISSQGGVIPALITSLAPSGATPMPPTAAKASLWALAPGAGWVRADYYPPVKHPPVKS